jgi:hypothetical protein
MLTAHGVRPPQVQFEPTIERAFASAHAAIRPTPGGG